MSQDIASVAEIASEPTDLLVAFASSDGDMVDEHFGSAAAFYLYRINASGSEFLSEKRFGEEKRDGNEDKLKPKLSWLHGADAVYIGSIGGSATRQLVALDIAPMQVAEGPDVADLVSALQQQLAGTPERWLEIIMQRKAKRAAGSGAIAKTPMIRAEYHF